MSFRIFNITLDKWVDVKGERVEIPGFEEFEFFVYPFYGRWRVGENSSGCHISQSDQATKELAIKVATRMIKAQGPHRMREVVGEAISRRSA
ncbi:MAG: hypothetical protein IT203_05230 [Fimbriimonadaceae bacterium]|nr:hypothetical protein [Fimbriimonadaceae bacterium]